MGGIREMLNSYRFGSMTIEEASKLNESEKLAFLLNKVDEAIEVYKDDMENEYICSIK